MNAQIRAPSRSRTRCKLLTVRFSDRDIGLLASARARPATTVSGVERPYPELAAKAAALLESMARFHPLINGNSYRHDFSTDAAFDLVVVVAAGVVSLEASAGMIASHLVKR